MQRLLFVLFQLDEARRYIEDGRLPHLRLALLLLDNAAEIQMDRYIREIWQRDALLERMRAVTSRLPWEHLPDSLRELVEWTSLSNKEKHKIDKFFDEKVAYLVRHGDLEEALAGPLKYVHKYRNEAYHRAQVRDGTIRTAALILLEINCHMVIHMAPGSSMYSSSEDYSWFQERFGCKPHDLFSGRDQLPIAVEDIRSRVLPSDAAVAQALAEHLRNRFAEMDDSLIFIAENGAHQSGKEIALRDSQFYAEQQRTGSSAAQMKGFVPKHTLQSISSLEEQIVNVSSAPTGLEAFHQFSLIEKDLEPIETDVSDMAAAIDDFIQAEIDRIRGK